MLNAQPRPSAGIDTEDQLEEALSRPTEADVEAMRCLEGDLLILGVSGKMGPSMARLARRACTMAKVRKRIFGVARFSSEHSREPLEEDGVETVACDLLEPEQIRTLPDCANVLYMVGQKFGTASNQPLTWATNAYVPALVAERFSSSRIVVLSTGNVYPLTDPTSGGPMESDPVRPIGEYAQSALARERIFEYFSHRHGTRISIARLNYAIDLRYGVLHDIARRVHGRQPVPLSMGYANVIWQRDANSIALRSLGRCSSPPFVFNLTGTETLSVRELAERFGELWNITPLFDGQENESALLSDARFCAKTFGMPETTTDEMIGWMAHWIERGGRTLGKPTHFETRSGEF